MTNNTNQNLNGVDAKLNSSEQQTISRIVKALPEDTVSMAWRSSLNEQLLAVAAKQRKKQRMLWFIRPALGLSLATVLAVVVMFHPVDKQVPIQPDHSVESAILSDHHNSVLMNEVSSTGLNANEVNSEVNPDDPTDEMWSEPDAHGL